MKQLSRVTRISVGALIMGTALLASQWIGDGFGGAPAEGQGASTTVTFVSGNGPVGGTDKDNFYAIDGKRCPASHIIAAQPDWSVIPGTQWISASPDGITPATYVTYRTIFYLPKGYKNAHLTIEVHAKNQVGIYLNNNYRDGAVVQQPSGNPSSNYQAPAETYVISDPARFVAGHNHLMFHVYNADTSTPTGVNYKATLVYSK